MSESITHDVTPTSVTEDLVTLDQVFTDATRRRNEVADILHTKIKGLTLDFAEPRSAEVQLQMVNTYLGLLKDNEASIGRRVGAKLRKTQSDTGSKHSEAVVELLAKLSSGSIPLNFGNEVLDADKAAERIDAAFQKNNLDPVSETELRCDPKDVT